jgi:putative transposase
LAASAASPPHRRRTPDPQPSYAAPTPTRTPAPATDGTDALHEQAAAHHQDRAQSTALANALAESFVDSFKTELIRDRVWKTVSQLELAIVEYVAWFNNERLHTSLGGLPPAEYEAVQTRR